MAECTTETRPESARTWESRCPGLRRGTSSAPLSITGTKPTNSECIDEGGRLLWEQQPSPFQLTERKCGIPATNCSSTSGRSIAAKKKPEAYVADPPRSILIGAED